MVAPSRLEALGSEIGEEISAEFWAFAERNWLVTSFGARSR
jgi:hypothetical protein